jgi:hypothetical protein
MKLLIAGAFLVLLGVAGFLLYVNYFGETDRTGGDVVKAAAWLSFAAGVALLLAGAVARARRPAPP